MKQLIWIVSFIFALSLISEMTLAEEQRDATQPLATTMAQPTNEKTHQETNPDEIESLELLFFAHIKPVAIASAHGEETVFNSVSTVSVIDREMIEKFNFSTISQAVEIVAGFTVWRTYLKTRVPMSRGILQDHYANKVLVMINNVPTWHPVTGEGALDRVSIDEVERIEVLKGPASVLYGSNAYTGAVNIVLRKAKMGKTEGKMHGGFGSGAGSYQGAITSRQAGGYYTETNDDYQFFIAANTLKEEWPTYRFLAEGGEEIMVNDYLVLNNFTAQGQYGSHSFLLNSALNEELYLGVIPDITSGINRNHEIELHLLQYGFDQQWDDLSIQYSLVYDWSRRNYSRSLDNNARSDIIGSRLANQLKAYYTFMNDWTVELGGDHEFRYSKNYTDYFVYEDKAIAENNLLNRDVQEYSGHLQLEYARDALKVLLGTRLTHNQFFGNNLSSRGTAVYTLNQNNSIKLIAGQSFRAPSIFEMNFVTVPEIAVFGNLDLKPELSTSYELAYLTSFKNLFVQVLGYYAIYENKIARTRGSAVYNGTTYNDVNVYQNGGRMTAKGTELELEYKLPFTRIFVTLEYVVGDDGDKVYEAADDSYHYNYKYVPQTMLSAGVSQSLGEFFFSGLISFMGAMNGPREYIEPNYSIDATVGYTAGRIQHKVSARNIGNNHIVVPEYVRRNLNEITLISGMRVDYSFEITF